MLEWFENWVWVSVWGCTIFEIRLQRGLNCSLLICVIDWHFCTPTSGHSDYPVGGRGYLYFRYFHFANQHKKKLGIVNYLCKGNDFVHMIFIPHEIYVCRMVHLGILTFIFTMVYENLDSEVPDLITPCFEHLKYYAP